MCCRGCHASTAGCHLAARPVAVRIVRFPSTPEAWCVEGGGVLPRVKRLREIKRTECALRVEPGQARRHAGNPLQYAQELTRSERRAAVVISESMGIPTLVTPTVSMPRTMCF